MAVRGARWDSNLKRDPGIAAWGGGEAVVRVDVWWSLSTQSHPTILVATALTTAP
jgi:hypothetical protein